MVLICLHLMIFDNLLLPQYVSTLDKGSLLDEIECTSLSTITAIKLVVKGRIMKVSFAKKATLIRGLSFTKFFELEQVFSLVISLNHLCPLIDH